METHIEGDVDLDFLRSCLVDAGRLAIGQRGQRIATLKADKTPVTVIDRQVEDYLIERIGQRYPRHAILSEETGLHGGRQETTWVIDPIDGTRAFASGLPVWGVSIGVLQGEKVSAGGLYLPVTGEMYWGTHRQAYYNDLPVPPVEIVDLDSPLVFLGVPSDFHMRFSIVYPRIRSIGSTAAQLAYVAVGAAVGELTGSVGLWDLAGVLPLLEATGIIVESLTGIPFHAADYLDGSKIQQPLLAAHPSVMPTLRSAIHSII